MRQLEFPFIIYTKRKLRTTWYRRKKILDELNQISHKPLEVISEYTALYIADDQLLCPILNKEKLDEKKYGTAFRITKDYINGVRKLQNLSNILSFLHWLLQLFFDMKIPDQTVIHLQPEHSNGGENFIVMIKSPTCHKNLTEISFDTPITPVEF